MTEGGRPFWAAAIRTNTSAYLAAPHPTENPLKSSNLLSISSNPTPRPNAFKTINDKTAFCSAAYRLDTNASASHTIKEARHVVHAKCRPTAQSQGAVAAR